MTPAPAGRKVEESVHRAYGRYRSTHADHITGMRAVDTTMQQLAPHLPPERDGLVVELGCGNGELIAALRARGFSSVVGVDASPEQVAAARELGVDVQFGDATDFVKNLSTPASLVLAMDFLEHLDREDLIDLCDAVSLKLEPGGLFIARLPNPQAPFGGSIAYGDITHRSHLAPLAALQLGRLVGFDDINIFPAPPAVFGWRTRARHLIWQAQQTVFRAMFAVESGLNTQRVFSLNYIFVARKAGGRQ